MSEPNYNHSVVSSTTEDLIYLLACSVNSVVPDVERVKGMDLAALFREAKRHMLSSAVAFALESAGVQNAAFTDAQAKAVRKMAIMDAEQVQILTRFEDAGIWYLPLKGAVLKSLYPSYGMREMSDRDILVDPARMADVRTIMEELGFTTEEYGKRHHDCYIKPPVSNFEIHHHLFRVLQGEQINDYYADVKSRLLKDEGNAFGWHFSPEDFYVHMTVHEYKHYVGGGTGLRSLLDTYVYLKNVNLNMAYVTAEAEKLGIAPFERENRKLAQALFGGGALTEAKQNMLHRFIRSGTYGNETILAENQLAEKGRWRYFLSRLTLPYPVMLEVFPILRRAPALYPFVWIYRLVSAVVLRGGNVKQQVSSLLTWRENKSD